MTVQQWIAIAAASALAIAALIFGLRSRRRRRSTAEARKHAARLQTVRDFIARLNEDDADVLSDLSAQVPGERRTTWRGFAYYGELNEEFTAAINAHEERRTYEKCAAILRKEMADWGPTGPAPERIQILIGIRRFWESTYVPTGRMREQLAAAFMSGDEAQSRLRTTVTAYAHELAAAALGDKEKFQELYALRASAMNHSSGEGPVYSFRYGWIDWPILDTWRQLVDEHIASPTCWDLGLNPVRPPIDFPREVVTALHSGTRLDAKIMQALLVEREDLRKLIPDHLIAAIYVFATNGERPQLDLLYATEAQSHPA